MSLMSSSRQGKKERQKTGGVLWWWITIYFCFRFRKDDIEQLISLTDSFTWEELPTRDPDTGHKTNAGYIPTTQNIATRVSVFLYMFHVTQSAVHLVRNHDMVLPAWLPFDASVSPAYEITNIVQVIKTTLCYHMQKKRRYVKGCYYSRIK
jgi:hypothetical protein